MFQSIFIFSVIGLCISMYIYSIEQKLKKNPNYKPMCDVSDSVSCTKPMKSNYAQMFYISNSVISMIFYSVLAVFSLLGMHKIIFFLVVAGCIVSCILAYFLYFRIKSLCILCTSLYIINFILLYLSMHHY